MWHYVSRHAWSAGKADVQLTLQDPSFRAGETLCLVRLFPYFVSQLA